MQVHGLACVRVPVDVRPSESSFEWILGQPDVTREDLIWYTDGSCSDPTTQDVARFGFAIVVVSKEGDLVAYGAGIPPDFVTDSGMAELWAVYTAVAMTPGQHDVVTDCLGILETARRGTAAATTAGSPNARLWKMMAARLDGDISRLADHLVWMPAHQTTAAIG